MEALAITAVAAFLVAAIVLNRGTKNGDRAQASMNLVFLGILALVVIVGLVVAR